MNKTKISGKFTLFSRIILYLVFSILLIHVGMDVYNEIRLRQDGCYLEKLYANRAELGSYEPPSNLLISTNDLPSRLSYTPDQGPLTASDFARDSGIPVELIQRMRDSQPSLSPLFRRGQDWFYHKGGW